MCIPTVYHNTQDLKEQAVIMRRACSAENTLKSLSSTVKTARYFKALILTRIPSFLPSELTSAGLFKVG